MIAIRLDRGEYDSLLRRLHYAWGFPTDDFSGQAYAIERHYLFGELGS